MTYFKRRNKKNPSPAEEAVTGIEKCVTGSPGPPSRRIALGKKPYKLGTHTEFEIESSNYFVCIL
jgi:hypothetical protein